VDVDGGGHLDVIAVNPLSNTISILYGNGEGTLQAPAAYPTGSSPQSIVAGEFNSDSHTDLAVVNGITNNMTVFIGSVTGVLSVVNTHTGDFLFNQVGAAYTVTATNNGPGVIFGTVTVLDTLPAGLTATAMSDVHPRFAHLHTERLFRRRVQSAADYAHRQCGVQRVVACDQSGDCLFSGNDCGDGRGCDRHLCDSGSWIAVALERPGWGLRHSHARLDGRRRPRGR
jgi:uncharacterized repeat protein (TIGR01451 family)